MQTRERLDQLRRIEDRRMGIAEEFLTPWIGGARTVAVLATPLSRSVSMGWVMCHSFGLEQINLQPVETPAARAVAAAGQAVLRFHCQGYGDSDRTAEHVSLGSHIGDTLEAVDLLISLTGVRRIGLIGARLGGTVAALVADKLDPAGLILWDPVVRGRTLMQAMARLSVMSELLIRGRSSDSADPIALLRKDGILDVQGFPLRREVFDEISEVDLVKDMNRFRGGSLVVQISGSGAMRPGIERLLRRLGALGGDCRGEVIASRSADRFGQPRFRPRATGKKVDTQSQLVESLISLTVSRVTELDETDDAARGRR